MRRRTTHGRVPWRTDPYNWTLTDWTTAGTRKSWRRVDRLWERKRIR
jgi:hypothetical protein